MQQMMFRASLAPPWANPVFLKQPVEEQLKQAVSWFFDALDNRIIKPNRAQPNKPEYKEQLRCAFKQAEGVVQGVVGHYDYLAASSNNWNYILDREVSVEQTAKSYFEAVQSRQHAVRERTQGKQAVVLSTLSFLFGGGANTTMGQYVAMLYALNLQASRAAIAEATKGQDVLGKGQGYYRYRVPQMLRLYAKIGGSFRLFQRVMNAFSAESGRRVTHDEWALYHEARLGIVHPEVYKLVHPEGTPKGASDYVGRYTTLWAHLMDECMENYEFIKSYVVRTERRPGDDASDPPRPCTMRNIHWDGAGCTSTSDVVLVTSQSLNCELADMQRPHNQDIVALDECKEHPLHLQYVWQEAIMPGLKRARQEGLPVRCLGKDAECSFCNYPDANEREYYRSHITPYQYKGEMVAVHLTDLFLFYTADRKALMMALPLKHELTRRLRKLSRRKTIPGGRCWTQVCTDGPWRSWQRLLKRWRRTSRGGCKCRRSGTGSTCRGMAIRRGRSRRTSKARTSRNLPRRTNGGKEWSCGTVALCLTKSPR